MFKHILLPTDGSELSRRAVAVGLELAATFKARVFALHVVPPFHTISYMAEMLAATEISYVEEAVARAERYLEEVRAAAKAAGVECQATYVFDDRPYQAIVQTASEQHCDLIVMASHGWRGMNRVLLGSETHKVILRSDLPVLVCH
jgi:nucleotide-binding universal stress UspA family protein